MEIVETDAVIYRNVLLEKVRNGDIKTIIVTVECNYVPYYKMAMGKQLLCSGHAERMDENRLHRKAIKWIPPELNKEVSQERAAGLSV